jgi:hypothetical protein
MAITIASTADAMFGYIISNSDLHEFNRWNFHGFFLGTLSC